MGTAAELQAELEARRGRVREILRGLTAPPSEALLLADVFEVRLAGIEGEVEADAAWGLVWAAFGVASGRPTWSSYLLDRVVRCSRRSRPWGGPESMYRSLLVELTRVRDELTDDSLGHFLRDIGRTARADRVALEGAPLRPPFTAWQSLAICYAPGAENFYIEMRDALAAAVRGARFEGEVRAGLGF